MARAKKGEAADVNAAETGTPADSTPNFETLLVELEAVVTRLERGDQTLEAALADFERGVLVARDARRVLEQAEVKLAQLAAAARGGAEEPWDGGGTA
jgi:exodeoxyribonuclease VII small subunit